MTQNIIDFPVLTIRPITPNQESILKYMNEITDEFKAGVSFIEKSTGDNHGRRK